MSTESQHTESTLDPAYTTLAIDLLTKGYSDTDLLRVIPEFTLADLEQLKGDNYEAIMVGMRDYYLLRKHSDDKMDELESIALERLEECMTMEMDTLKVLKIFQVLNTGKRRSEGEGNTPATVVNQQVVHLNLPNRMIGDEVTIDAPKFITNPNNEVVRVGSRDMTTATNTQVLSHLKARNESKGTLQSHIDYTIDEDGELVPNQV